MQKLQRPIAFAGKELLQHTTTIGTPIRHYSLAARAGADWSKFNQPTTASSKWTQDTTPRRHYSSDVRRPRGEQDDASSPLIPKELQLAITEQRIKSWVNAHKKDKYQPNPSALAPTNFRQPVIDETGETYRTYTQKDITGIQFHGEVKGANDERISKHNVWKVTKNKRTAYLKDMSSNIVMGDIAPCDQAFNVYREVWGSILARTVLGSDMVSEDHVVQYKNPKTGALQFGIFSYEVPNIGNLHDIAVALGIHEIDFISEDESPIFVGEDGATYVKIPAPKTKEGFEIHRLQNRIAAKVVLDFFLANIDVENLGRNVVIQPSKYGYTAKDGTQYKQSNIALFDFGGSFDPTKMQEAQDKDIDDQITLPIDAACPGLNIPDCPKILNRWQVRKAPYMTIAAIDKEKLRSVFEEHVLTPLSKSIDATGIAEGAGFTKDDMLNAMEGNFQHAIHQIDKAGKIVARMNEMEQEAAKQQMQSAVQR